MTSDNTIDIVCNFQQAKDILNKYDDNYSWKVNNLIGELFNGQREWIDGLEFGEELKHKITQINKSYSDPLIQISSDCIIFNRLHGFFMPLLYEKYKADDQWYFNKTVELSNITAEQLGAPVEYTIPLLAAVVELTSLDNHKSPWEKICCLCTSYDFIFAELKIASINVISKFSVSESEIPVINNSDIIPILMTVIIKSKLIHLQSNFYYINAFLGCLNKKENIRHVLTAFNEAINRINDLSIESLKPGSANICKNMDLIKFMTVTEEINTKLKQNKAEITPLDGQLIDITELIVISTNQHQLLPNQ